MIELSWLEALEAAGELSAKQLEKRFGAEAARWASVQFELRKKARAKFADASSMLFEREALEQATHEAVARYHASRFPEGAAVVDITAGIGSDLRAFGPGAVGFEIDEMRLIYASFNCKTATVRNDDGLAFVQESGSEYIWADPDRRDGGGRRLADPSAFLPNPLEIPRDRQLTGIKLSPLLSDEYLESVGDRVEFVSFGGECREAIAWSGSLVQESGIFAVQVENGEVLPRREIYEIESEPMEVIYDADPAATRAHALGGFGMPQLGDSPGYLTGSAIRSPWLNAYEVLASGSFDAKRIKDALRGLDARVFEVKQRGAGLDPTTVMRSIKTDGERQVSLICWRIEKSVRFALASRM